MERFVIFGMLICVFGVMSTSCWSIRPTLSMETTAKSWTTPVMTKRPIVIDIRNDNQLAATQIPRLIEQYDRRQIDGRHEFRYELSDGTCKYERSYWKNVDNKRILARKGFYSYPLPDKHFLTVFYTADDKGYQLDSSTYSVNRTALPDRIDVPEVAAPPKQPPRNNKNITGKSLKDPTNNVDRISTSTPLI